MASGLARRHEARARPPTGAAAAFPSGRRVLDSERPPKISPVLEALNSQAGLIENGGLRWLPLKKFRDRQD